MGAFWAFDGCLRIAALAVPGSGKRLSLRPGPLTQVNPGTRQEGFDAVPADLNRDSLASWQGITNLQQRAER